MRCWKHRVDLASGLRATPTFDCNLVLEKCQDTDMLDVFIAFPPQSSGIFMNDDLNADVCHVGFAGYYDGSF